MELNERLIHEFIQELRQMNANLKEAINEIHQNNTQIKEIYQ